MSLPQHRDPKLKFEQQRDNSENYVMPFIEERFQWQKGMKVMEVGCGEGGVLVPFLRRGCQCVGIDLNSSCLDLAGDFLRGAVDNGSLELVSSNIYDIDFWGRFSGQFNLIILKDSIEHIQEQEKLMSHLKKLLTCNGKIFLGFPPWHMPYGGHQQICNNKWLSKFLYIHLLPRPLYRGLLKLGKEDDNTIQELLELKRTGLSIERFEHILSQHGYKIVLKRFYSINPIYKYKFGWRPRIQNSLIARLPYIRNFITSCVYYLIEENRSENINTH